MLYSSICVHSARRYLTKVAVKALQIQRDNNTHSPWTAFKSFTHCPNPSRYPNGAVEQDFTGVNEAAEIALQTFQVNRTEERRVENQSFSHTSVTVREVQDDRSNSNSSRFRDLAIFGGRKAVIVFNQDFPPTRAHKSVWRIFFVLRKSSHLPRTKKGMGISVHSDSQN